MNVEMWNNPANLRNIEQLVSDGITVFTQTVVNRLAEKQALAEWSKRSIWQIC